MAKINTVKLTDAEIYHLLFLLRDDDDYYGNHESYKARHDRIIDKLAAGIKKGVDAK